MKPYNFSCASIKIKGLKVGVGFSGKITEEIEGGKYFGDEVLERK